MNYFQYSDAMVEWLRVNYPRFGIDELAQKFNAKFDADRTGEQLRGACKRRGIKCGRGPGDLKRGRCELVTPEQKQWLVDHYVDVSREWITAEFNKTFGTSLKLSQMVAFLKNHGIRSGRTGHFGERPSWNKGTKGVCKANAGSFKKGNIPENVKELYAERLNVYGYVEIKIPEPNPYKPGQQTRYVPKHRWLWEQRNGPIPRNHVVIFDDGDRQNFAMDNLRLVSRAELQQLNTLGYFTSDGELKGVISVTAALTAMASNPARNLEISQREIIVDAIKCRAMTYRHIAKHTGIEPRTVAAILSVMQRRGVVKKAGKGESPSGRTAYLWRAA